MSITPTISVLLSMLAGSDACLIAQEKPKAEQRHEVDPKDLADFTSTLLEVTNVLHEEYIKPISEGQLVDWAIRGLYQSVGERIPGDLAARLQNAVDGKEKPRDLLADARKHLGERPGLSACQDIDLALGGIFRQLPGTKLEPRNRERFLASTTGERWHGIGVQLRYNPGTYLPQVETTLKDGPAYQGKVLAGDVITHVTCERNGQRITHSTQGLSLADVEKLLGGPAGTRVTLTLQREGINVPVQCVVACMHVEPETVFGFQRGWDDNPEFILDPVAKIAYMHLNNLSGNTHHDLGRMLAGLDNERIRGLILDLRFSPGGRLDNCVAIAELFLSKGLITSVQMRQFPPMVYECKNNRSRRFFPMVCLVNGDTARTSEVLAACLQDHHRALIVSERSSGETEIRTIYVRNYTYIWCTTAICCRPNGKNLTKMMTSGKATDDWGVMPDAGFEVPLSTPERAALREQLRRQEIIPRRDKPMPEVAPGLKDRQLEKALECLRQRVK